MKKFAWIFVLGILFASTVRASDLPKPPQGFTWQQVPELKAAFLKPDGWFFKQDSDKGTLAFFITKEDLKGSGQFETGLTVNVFRLKQDSAVERGKALIEKMASEHHAKPWEQSVGPFKEFGCEMKDTDSSGTTVMHSLTIANPKTNTLYLFIFESPEQTWDAEWKLGKPMMDAPAIDDEM